MGGESLEKGSQTQQVPTVLGNAYADWEYMSTKTSFFEDFSGCYGKCDSESCGFPYVLKKAAKFCNFKPQNADKNWRNGG